MSHDVACDVVSRGHNEMDNPTLTQPIMYKEIDSRSTVPDLYSQQLEVSSQSLSLLSTSLFFSHHLSLSLSLSVSQLEW